MIERKKTTLLNRIELMIILQAVRSAVILFLLLNSNFRLTAHCIARLCFYSSVYQMDSIDSLRNKPLFSPATNGAAVGECVRARAFRPR